MKRLVLSALCLILLGRTGAQGVAADVSYKQDSLNPSQIDLHITVLARLPYNNGFLAGISWGDGASISLPVPSDTTTRNVLPSLYLMTFNASHIYSDTGDSVMTIGILIGTRLSAILNMSSLQPGGTIPFYIKATISLAALRNNAHLKSPVFLAPLWATDSAVGVPLIYNPLPLDSQGDSLLIRLVPPLQDQNYAVPQYFPPNLVYNFGSDTIFSFDDTTGNIVWNSPQGEGYYDIAFKASKYRNGQFIGSVMRDMNLLVFPDSFFYTGIVNITTDDFNLDVYPNPTINNLIGIFSTMPSNARATIMSADGRVIISNILVQQNRFEVNVSDLAPGLYFLTLQNDKERWMKKFVKE